MTDNRCPKCYLDLAGLVSHPESTCDYLIGLNREALQAACARLLELGDFDMSVAATQAADSARDLLARIPRLVLKEIEGDKP